MTKAQILTRCRNGERLAKTLYVKSSGNAETSYYLAPSGPRVTRRQAEKLIASGLFVPTGDGLFDAELSQTWTLKS